MRYFLCVDNGGTSSKAALFDEEGRLVAAASRRIAIEDPRPGWSERDMETMWQDTASAIREVLSRAGRQPDAIGCTGHGNGLYLIDASGKPVRKAINSSDTRAQAIVDQWKACGTGEQVLPKTAQSLWPGQPNALLRWLEDNEPETVRRTRWAMMAKDYTRFRLTDAVHAELTDFSGTSLLNVAAAAYDDEVLAAFGLESWRNRLPELCNSSQVCGCVTPEAARATGLSEGIPVAGGMFDIDACGLASGMVDEAGVAMVAGTWGNTLFLTRRPVVDPELFMTSCYSIPGWYLALEGSPTSASNLEWGLRELGLADYEEANRLVESVRPSETDPLFLPFLYGTHSSAPAKACYIGLDARHTRAHLVRAIYEGVVLASCWHFDRMLKFRRRPATVRLSGGAARSSVWVRMFAGGLDAAVETPDGTELGALGAAIAAAVAYGTYSGYETAVQSMTRISQRFEPEREDAAISQRRYHRYLHSIERLEPYWKSNV